MNDLYKKLKEFGKVKLNEPMNKHTTFKIGGSADYFVIVENTKDLVNLLTYLDEHAYDHSILGGGSNMLFRDSRYKGVVIQVKSQSFEVQGDTIIADAGCTTVSIANLSMKHTLAGFEWGVGVPGTLGGAVRGNAGAMGRDMSQSVDLVEAYLDGEVVEFKNADCNFHYRESIFKDIAAVILRVHLKLEKIKTEDFAGQVNVGLKKALEYLQYRSKTQPQGFASTGCIFKNFEIKGKKLNFDFPEEFAQKGVISAGWLIDQAGMKGTQIGMAKVSDAHGNFIINLGDAKASDVLSLIDEVKEKVYNKFGITLEEEIQLL